MLKKGDLIDGKYEILSKIGEGGMSNVYLALNRKAMKQWAIKEVRRDGVEDFEVVKQSLIAETDMLKKLSHPNLPDIVDIIETDDYYLIVMDYIEGKPLSKILKEGGAQPEQYVIEWAKQLCDVLDYLHTRKPPIIYRDMKPSNVMLQPDGKVCLIDFGTAREYKQKNLSDTVCLGTVGYAAPEQFGGFGQTDARTDVYCLGATLYHLVTGHCPADPPYGMHPIRYWNENLSPGFEAIITKCTQNDPDDRFQSCAELRYALDHIDEEVYEYWSVQKKKINIFLTSIILTLVCLFVGVFGFVLNYFQKSPLYDVISIVGFALSALCVLLSVIFYFVLNIKDVLQYLSDDRKKKSINDMRIQQNEYEKSSGDNDFENMINYYDIDVDKDIEQRNEKSIENEENENKTTYVIGVNDLNDSSTEKQNTKSALDDDFDASATVDMSGATALADVEYGEFKIIKKDILIHTEQDI